MSDSVNPWTIGHKASLIHTYCKVIDGPIFTIDMLKLMIVSYLVVSEKTKCKKKHDVYL